MKAFASAAICLVVHASAARAQSAPAPTPPSSRPTAAVSWRVAGGQDVVALRDIARSTFPVDASPVAWRGEGASVLIEHHRTSGRRVHRFEVSAMHAGRFAYDSGIATIARPDTDRFSRLDGRYEYRRYLWTDAVLRGLDVGAGLHGGAWRTSLTRHLVDNIEAAEARTGASVAVVAAAGFRRSRFGVDVAWTNGGQIGQARERHSADPAPSRTRWGGGWLTDLAISADIAVWHRASVAVHYLRSGDGWLSSHRGLASSRRRLVAGVTYAR